MLYSLKGQMIDRGVNFVAVECGGVGYKANVSANTLAQLPGIDEEVMIYTYLYVREGAIDLFGFWSKEELRSFKMLTEVSGVGPKVALAILSDLTPDKVAIAIAAGDAKAFTKASGVGAKLAARIVMELKDKVGKEDITPGEPAAAIVGASGNIGETIAALTALGYTSSEAAMAASRCPPDMPVNDMIKKCLKDMSIFR